MALGLFLAVWIAAQIYWFGGVHWLQVSYLALGLLECVLGWPLRRQLARAGPGGGPAESSRSTGGHPLGESRA